MHYIFEIRLKPGYTAEQYAEGWLEASRIIQQAPGARGTRLHRKIGEPDVLLAIATWESKTRRDEMESTHDPRVQAIIDSQMPHVEFHLIGEFEAPEWEVIPPGVA